MTLGWRWCDQCGINPVVADPEDDDIAICAACERALDEQEQR